jgi:hypothetical protein
MMQPSAEDCGVSDAEYAKAKSDAKRLTMSFDSISMGKCFVKNVDPAGVVVYINNNQTSK